MRVGMYNRWLSTLGGGEKYTLSIAERISQYYPVDVINHKQVSKEYASERLDLDLSRINFVVTPELAQEALPSLTQKYNLFINVSHMDFFPSLADHGAWVVYFPAKQDLNVRFRRRIKGLIRNWFNLSEMVLGGQRFDLGPGTIRWFTDPAVKLKLPVAQRSYQFQLDLTRLDENIHSVQVYLDDVPLDLLHFKGKNEVRCVVDLPAGGEGKKHELFLLAQGVEDISGLPRLILHGENLSLPTYQVYQRMLKTPPLSTLAYNLNFYPPANPIADYFKTYETLWTCSAFSQEWIRKYWHCDSEVLYPSINVSSYHSGNKCQRILNVGRFFAGSHNKKHLEQIQAFRGMVDQGLIGWELHLAGGLNVGEEHKKYFETVQAAAEGYPIFLHPNIPNKELIQLYSESAIYWHASGFGEDENLAPEKSEHFGITTTEAMASGCCPVVIKKGGQPEIVKHGETGFLWQTLEELQQYTRLLIENEALRQSISQAARLSSQRYDRSQFEAQVDAFLARAGLLP